MGATRREALAGAAAAGVALALPSVAAGADDEQRREAALKSVLGLEQTALVAYEAIANAGVLTTTLRMFLEQERQHADQLETALQNMGSKPPIPPKRTAIRGLGAATTSKEAAARFAIALELRTIAAYQGAIALAADPSVLRTNAGAMGTDAQQLVVLRRVAGVPLVPRAFETGRPA